MVVGNETAPYSVFTYVSGVAWYLTTFLAVVFVPPLLWMFSTDEAVPRGRRTSGVLVATALLIPPIAAVVAVLAVGALR
jgi:hypothetical protein